MKGKRFSWKRLAKGDAERPKVGGLRGGPNPRNPTSFGYCGYGAAELVVAVLLGRQNPRCTLFRGGRNRVRVMYGKWVGLRTVKRPFCYGGNRHSLEEMGRTWSLRCPAMLKSSIPVLGGGAYIITRGHHHYCHAIH